MKKIVAISIFSIVLLSSCFKEDIPVIQKPVDNQVNIKVENVNWNMTNSWENQAPNEFNSITWTITSTWELSDSWSEEALKEIDSIIDEISKE